MEWLLAIALFCSPLVGLYAPKKPDGWTTYRDRVLIIWVLSLLGWILFYQTAFGIIFALIAWRYRSSADLHGVVIWGFIFGIWMIVQMLSLQQYRIIITAILLAATGQCLLGIVDFIVFLWKKHASGSADHLVFGTMGNRTYYGAYLAIVSPLAAREELWWLLVLLGIGVVVSMSRMAIPAYVIGVGIAWPTTLYVTVPILGIAWMIVWKKLVYSAIMDGVRARMLVLRLLLHYTLKWPYWLIGHGYNTFHETIFSWCTDHGTLEGYAHAHNDTAQVFYEYGVIGLIAVSFIIYLLYPNMAIGSTLTGSVVAMVVTSFTTFPNHIAPIGVTIVVIMSMLSRVSL